jgi:two-component system, NtrC family, nitrogen regulation sensor histidine kinase NtrY
MDHTGQAALPAVAAGPQRSLIQRCIDWSRRVRLERKFTIFVLILAVTSGVATFAATTGQLPGTVSPTTLVVLLLTDFVCLLMLCALVARRLVLIWMERRRGLAGAKLHARLVGLFSLVAVAPAIVVAVFSAVLFDFGLRVWFSDRVSTVVKNSLEVAEAYLEEHQRTVYGEALAIARSINAQGPVSLLEPELLQQLLEKQVGSRALAEAVIFDRGGRELGRGGYSIWAEFDPRTVENSVLEQARGGEVVLLPEQDQARIGAITRLDSFTDTYLYVARLVDSQILGQLDQSRGAVALYEELEGDRYDLQITFALVFLMVAALLLLVAVWVGLSFANQLTRPIGGLISAAQRVARGDLTARVPVEKSGDEIASLSQAFNTMTAELQEHQGELMTANRQIDERRRFIEAVLGGISSGVIGLDAEGRIALVNRTAQDLLGAPSDELRGRALAELFPETDGLIRAARLRPGRAVDRQLSFLRPDGQERSVFVRVAAQQAEEGISGFVSTLDDVTELLAAQRKAAWADIARRIAHEIKNPLTPIQLSAERLKRKYLKQITDDPETFAICTDTIVRQVGDIGRMVDEFSSFARMPAPVMIEHSLRELIQQAIFLQQSAQPTIRYASDLPAGPLVVTCDAQQVNRALTNLLLNAAEAIEGRTPPEDDGEELPQGEIGVLVFREDNHLILEVADNGRGLPKTDRQRLTEPYVTTRARGTGLGLAIVKKIMEEHGGEVTLDDRPGGGARVRLVFPASRLRSAKRIPDDTVQQREQV